MKIIVDSSVLEKALYALELDDSPMTEEHVEEWDRATNDAIAALREALASIGVER